MLANGVLCRAEEERFVFVINAGIAADWLADLRKFIMRAKVRAELLPVLFFGEDVDSAAALADSEIATVTQQDGVTTLSDAARRLHFAAADSDAAARFAEKAGQTDGDDNGDAWARGEISRAVPWIGAETRGQFIPQFVNFDALGGVDFDKGCYVGQEIIIRLHHLGAVKQRAYRLSGDGAPPPPLTPLTTAAGQPAGAIINSAPTPDGDGYAALAAVKLSAAPCGGATAAPLLVDGNAPAAVNPPPYPLPAAAPCGGATAAPLLVDGNAPTAVNPPPYPLPAAAEK